MPGRTLNVRISVDVDRGELVQAITHLVCVDGLTVEAAIASLPIGRYLHVTSTPQQLPPLQQPSWVKHTMVSSCQAGHSSDRPQPIAPGNGDVPQDSAWQPREWDAVYERPRSPAD